MKNTFNRFLCLLISATLVSCSSNDERLQKYIARADAAFEAGSYKVAVVEYMNAIKFDKDNARAYRQLGLAHYNLNNKREAFMHLSRALILHPGDLSARAQRATILFEAQQLDQVRKETEIILEQEPAHKEALLLWAHTNFAERDLPEAEKRIENQLKATADEPVLLLARGIIRLRMKKLMEAEKDMIAAVKQSPDDGRPHIALGNLLLHQKRMDEAETLIRQGVSLSPPRSSHALWGVVYNLRTGKVDAARAELEEILKRVPDFIPAQNLLSAILFGEQEFEACAILINQIIKNDPGDFEALVLRARLHQAKNDTEKALEEFGRLSERFPYASLPHYEIAKIHARSGDTARATSCLDEALKLTPSDLDIRLFRCRILSRAGRYAEAVLELKEIIEEHPQLLPPYSLLATTYTNRGTPGDAVKLYEQFSTVFPNDASGPYRKALVLLQLERKPEARVAIEESLAINPRYIPALSILVQLDAESERAAHTMSRLQAVIDDIPQAPGPLFLKACALLKQGKNEEAKTVLVTLLEQTPNALGAYMLLAMIVEDYNRESPSFQKLEILVKDKPADHAIQLFYAMMLERISDLTKAAEQYEHILATNPNATIAANNLAVIYSEHLGKPERAYELAEHAHTLNQSLPEVADTLGWILYLRGEFVRARDLLIQCTEKLPENPQALHRLGTVYYTMNQRDDARLALERALEYAGDSSFNGAPDVRERLAILDATPPLDSASIALCEKRIAASPPDLQALLCLGAHHLNHGHAKDALPLFLQAHQRNPQITEPLLQLARVHINHLSAPQKGMEYVRKARSLVAPTDSILTKELQTLTVKADAIADELLNQESGR
jgi:tetratricopeptide (TPR) repeat protein